MKQSQSQETQLAILSLLSFACSVIGWRTLLLLEKNNVLNFNHAEDNEDENTDYEDSLPSIIKHFKSLSLKSDTTVSEANKRRTVSYYEKAREAHDKDYIPGCPKELLAELRLEEIDRILRYKQMDVKKSHRTIVVMCDNVTQNVLSEARRMILEPLKYSNDQSTSGVWIPDLNIIPECDMHVTIALPWWWHTIANDNSNNENYELSREIAARFRQTLLLKFHHPFQIELQQIVLLGGKVLVALWRCVGERYVVGSDENKMPIYDRHGDSVDPMVRLRAEIVRCFTTASPDNRRQPLTYTHNKMKNEDTAKFENMNAAKDESEVLDVNLVPQKSKIKRRHTIEKKTPGYGEMGEADGFIHTTLCRLPGNCLSTHDIDLAPIHRLCREASATFSGHRMVVGEYRFLETTGEGGESNPCVKPIYEEIIEAPRRHNVTRDGKIEEVTSGMTFIVERSREQSNQTIGHSSIFPISSNDELKEIFNIPKED